MRPAVLSAAVLGQDQQDRSAHGPSVDLGSVGRCPTTPTLTVAVCDDSGSVTAPGGSDPVSARYDEIRLAVRHLARSCRCDAEVVAVVHFDTPRGDVAPQRLDAAGTRRLASGLRLPSGGRGTSDLLPAMSRVAEVAEGHPEHRKVLAILSDFELTDSEPEVVSEALESFPGVVIACVLGRSSVPTRYRGVDRYVPITAQDPPGAVARIVAEALSVHRRPGRNTREVVRPRRTRRR